MKDTNEGLMRPKKTEDKEPNIIVIDPQNEYKELCERFKGELIRIDPAKDKGGWINPFTGEYGTYDKNGNKIVKKFGEYEEALNSDMGEKNG